MSADFPVFRAGEQEWSSARIMAMAEFLGLVIPVRQALTEELAATCYADEEAFDVPAETLQEATDAFRYRHDLLTTEDTEAWMNTWQVTLDDLADYVARKHWAARFGGTVDGLLRDFSPDPETVESALWNEAVFDDAFRAWAIESARRAAAWLEAGGPPASPARREAVRRAFLERTGIAAADVDSWCRRTAIDAEQFTNCLDLEACHEDTVAAAIKKVDPGALLAGKTMGLTWLVMERAAFPSAAAAREAALCIKDDQEPFAEVAARVGAEPLVQSAFLDDLPDPFRQLCLSAAPGEVVGPIERDGAFVLLQLREKRNANPDDDAVRQRLAQDAIDSSLGLLVSKHVVWLVNMEQEA